MEGPRACWDKSDQSKASTLRPYEGLASFILTKTLSAASGSSVNVETSLSSSIASSLSESISHSGAAAVSPQSADEQTFLKLQPVVDLLPASCSAANVSASTSYGKRNSAPRLTKLQEGAVISLCNFFIESGGKLPDRLLPILTPWMTRPYLREQGIIRTPRSHTPALFRLVLFFEMLLLDILICLFICERVEVHSLNDSH